MVSAVGDVRRGPADSHVLSLHQSELPRRVALAGWIRRGLQQHEKIVYAELEPLHSEHSLAGVLAVADLDITVPLAAGQIEFVTLEALYAKPAPDVLLNTALAQGWRGLRIVSAPELALRVCTLQRFAGLERLAARLTATAPVSVLCSYDPRRPPLDEATMYGTHTTVRDDQLCAEREGASIRLTGSGDATNTALITGLTRAWTAATPGDVTVDVSGTHFLSLAACRGLLAGLVGPAGSPRSRRTVRLTGVAAQILQTLRLLRAEEQVVLVPAR